MTAGLGTSEPLNNRRQSLVANDGVNDVVLCRSSLLLQNNSL